MLTCHHDCLMAICSAKALNLAADVALPWVFHDDGTLTRRDKERIRLHFPGCRLVERAESDARYQEANSVYAELGKLRQKYVLLVKLLDVYLFSSQSGILFVDSDVLFFTRPAFLLDRLNESQGPCYFNRDVASVYVAPVETILGMTGVQIQERLNSGLFILNRDDISLEKAAKVLSQLDFSLRDDWTFYYGHMIEQTVVATLASASEGGAQYLPSGYDVSVEKPVADAICKHYVGVIREQYELEGLNYLLVEKQFLKRWKAFCSKRGLDGSELLNGRAA